MIVAIWIIAICEIIRAVQNAVQLMMMRGNQKPYETACDAFVQSIKKDDRERVLEVLEEFERQYGDKEEMK